VKHVVEKVIKDENHSHRSVVSSYSFVRITSEQLDIAIWLVIISSLATQCLYKTDFERELLKIWGSNPCHVIKAKIGKFSIHHGSFHSLKKGGLVNDEVCIILYVNSSWNMCM